MSDLRNESAKELRQNETKAESLLWELLRGKQLCGLKFRRQHPVDPFFADLACVSEQLIVEIDGGYHEKTVDKDLNRQRFLETKDWKVLRFSNEDVLDNVESVTRAIAMHLSLGYELIRRSRITRDLPKGKVRASVEPATLTCVDTNAQRERKL